jgi:hypothetical protein
MQDEAHVVLNTYSDEKMDGNKREDNAEEGIEETERRSRPQP